MLEAVNTSRRNYLVVMLSSPWMAGENLTTTGVNITLTMVVSLMRVLGDGSTSN